MRTTLPILSCVVFVLKKNTLILKTSDLEQTILSSIETQSGEDGSVAIPVGKLIEIVSALKEEELKCL